MHIDDITADGGTIVLALAIKALLRELSAIDPDLRERIRTRTAETFAVIVDGERMLGEPAESVDFLGLSGAEMMHLLFDA